MIALFEQFFSLLTYCEKKLLNRKTIEFAHFAAFCTSLIQLFVFLFYVISYKFCMDVLLQCFNFFILIIYLCEISINN